MADESPQTPHTPSPAADPQSIEGLFLQALGQSPQERQTFLDEACGDDTDRRRRIEALLRAYEDAGSFLEKPPAGVDTASTLSLEFLTPSDDPGLLGMLGPYEVYEMLGRGGMGIVFRARDPKLNRVVAIKVLAPELAANPNARRRFLREAQAAAAISHPHVVTIHAVDEGSTASTIPDASSIRDGSVLPFIVMECIVGQTLQQKLDKQGSLRLTEILRIGHQTAQGLAAAHRQGLIHRDIKPANILLENGVERVKITDFGLARAADDVSITRTGEVSGTPQYMSPEQASGGTIDHRSDLFSLGCVLYAMCTGRSPFRATTLAAAIRRVCDDTPRPIEEINPEAPRWLIEIVNRLLAKNPDERIQSADEVAELLGDHLAGIQHPPRARTAESPRARAVASASQRAAAAPVARGLGMNVPLRLLLWMGAIALLIPIFFALIGTAIGAGGDALEGAVVAAVICWPIALVAFAVALLDRSLQGNPFANALFLLVCILLGPIGILLYLVRRDQYLMTDRPTAESTAPRHVAQQQPPDKGESGNVPQWLVTPLPGPVKVIAFVLFAAACLVLGQAIEQWFDVSHEVGICLYAAAIPLAVLAIQCALGAGVQFRWPQVATLGLLGIVLAYFGAQAPDREFKYGLRAEPETAALFTAGLYLVAIPISLLLWGLSQAGEKGRARRDLLGTALIWIGATIWGALVAWLLLVSFGAVPPPPFSASSWIAAPIMFAVMLGGLFFGAGMILRSYVVTPGLVRRVAAGAEQGVSDAGAVSTPAASTAGTSPWRVLGWMIIAGLVLVPGCLVVWLGLPYLALERSDIGIVQIEFDSARPISWVAALGDVGAARSEQRAIEEPVTSNPYRLALPEGVYDLTMTWQAEGRTGTFAQRVKVEAGKTKRLDVRQNIALALQPQLDQRPQDDDGYPPPRTIPLVEEGQPAGDLPGMAGAMPGGEFGDHESPPGIAEGAVLLTITDPGLSVVFDPDEEDAMEGDAAAMGGGTMYDEMMGGVGGMMPYGMGGWMGATSSGTVKLPEGTYRVLVTDQLAGWGRAPSSRRFGGTFSAGSPEAQLPVSELPERLQVAAGEFRKLTVSRDLKRVAALQPDWQQRGFFAFRWNGETYDLTRTQAVVLQRLLEASLTDAPAIHEALLLAPAEMSAETRKLEPVTLSLEEAQQRLADSEQPTLESLFNEGQHPAWGSVIIPGEQPESYRLAELRAPNTQQLSDTQPNEQVTLQIDFKDPGLNLSLEAANGDSVVGPWDETTTTRVEPGFYTAVVEDDLAGWHSKDQFGQTGPVRYKFDAVKLAPGESRTIGVDRNFYKMAAGFPMFLHAGAQDFRWQGQTYSLSGMQRVVVAVLLKKYAEGEPEVHEAQLLKGATFVGQNIIPTPILRGDVESELEKLRADGHSLKALFDDGEHPAWGTLVVEGEKPNTYRLAELVVEPAAEGASMPSAEAASVAGLAINVEDAGLIARIFSADTDEPRQPLHEIADSAVVTLPVGRYDVWVEDRVAGWHRFNSDGEPGPVQYEYERLRIVTPGSVASTDRRRIPAGITQSLKISRNLHKSAAGLVPQHGRSQKFRWQEQSYDLAQEQWPVVAILLRAYADGEPDVHEAQLLAGASFRGGDLTLNPLIRSDADEALATLRESGHSLENIFDNGEHPAWGTLIVAGEKPNTYRLAELQIPEVVPPAEPGEMGAAPDHDSAPLAGAGALAGGLQGRSGQLTIDIREDGFLVAVRRRSAFDGIVAGSEQQVTDVGVTYLRVAPGEYEVLIRDQLFGWAEDRTQTVRVGTSDPPFLTIERDLARYAEGRPGTSTFRWDGRDYTLRYLAGPSAIASRLAINRLLAAYAQGSFDVADEKLVAAWKEDDPDLYRNLPGREPQTLEELFLTEGAEENEKHPWGRLIVPGETEGTYRLAPLDRGTIEVTDFAPGMVVTVAGVEPDPRFSRRQLFEEVKLQVPPGEYRYVVGDDFVGWGRWQPNASSPGFGPNENPVRSGSISVLSGESIFITADRRWADYIDPPEPKESNRWIPFMWFPKYEPHHTRPHVWGVRVWSDSPDNGIDNFDVPQFRVLRELLRAFADGQPEVAAAELLRRAGVEAEAWEDVFPADGRGYGGRWQTIIVPGKTDGTWRLKPLPSDAEQ